MQGGEKLNKDYNTPFDYLDYANIVKTRDGEYYIAVIFGNHICFMNDELLIGVDKNYDTNLKSETDESFDIVELYKCNYIGEEFPLKLLDLEMRDKWELIWDEINGGHIEIF